MRRTALLASALAAALAASLPAGAAAPVEAELLRIDDSGFVQEGQLGFTPVAIDLDAARAAIGTGRVLRVPHPEGGELAYRYLSHIEHPDGTLTWVGRTAEAIRGREAVLTFGGGIAVGTLPVDGGGTLSLTVHEGRQMLQQDFAEAVGGTSALQAPDTSVPSAEQMREMEAWLAERGPIAASAPAAEPGTSADDTIYVDVMLAYTSEFSRAYGSDAAARAILQNRIDQGNQALTTGGVNARYRLVATPRVDFDDMSDSAQSNSNALSYITYWGRAGASPLAIRLHTLRLRHGADIVGLVRRFNASEHVSCGNGWVGGYQGNNIAGYINFGYFTASVGTEGGFFCRDLTIGHEIGHNLGQNHNIEDANNTRDGAHTYSHGWRDNPAGQPRGFFTMMAYSAANQDQAISVSSPTVTAATCKNAPCGTATDDVARSLNLTMPVVTNWVASTSSTSRAISGQRGHFFVTLENLPALTNARWRAEFAGGGTITVTGPTMLPANTPAVARVAWDNLPLATGSLPVRIVAESSPGVTAGFVDLSLTRPTFSADGRAWQATERMLHDNVAAQVQVGQWQSGRAVDENRLFFHVPPTATEVTFTVTAGVDVDIFAAPAGADAASSPLLGGSVARTVPEASDTGTALTKTLTLSGASLTPGRWNIALSRPFASTLNTTQATVTARVTQRTTPPALTPGQYFNPARDGHGIFIDPAGADWIGVWYSYLEDGSPTWYYLQGAAPGASGIWVATIYRVGWNGSSAHTTVIGDLSVTPTSSTAMVLNYNIDGESGSEPMIQLGGTGCPTSGGAPLRATGHWFSPARSGFGYSAQYEPDQEIYAAYLYDAQGQPRWMLAQAAFNDAQINFPVRQYAGSCPLCGHVPTSSVQTGTLTRTLGTNGDGLRGITNMRLTGTFSGLASGSWTQDFPTTLLSARRTCP